MGLATLSFSAVDAKENNEASEHKLYKISNQQRRFFVI
jgi:hypothetical protein